MLLKSSDMVTYDLCNAYARGALTFRCHLLTKLSQRLPQVRQVQRQCHSNRRSTPNHDIGAEKVVQPASLHGVPMLCAKLQARWYAGADSCALPHLPLTLAHGTGICQRNVREFFKHLSAQVEETRLLLTNFFATNVASKFPSTHCTRPVFAPSLANVTKTHICTRAWGHQTHLTCT